MSTSTESSSLNATSRTVGLSSPGPAVISQSPGQSDFLADKLAGTSLGDESSLLDRRRGSTEDSTDDEGEMSLRRYSLDMEEYHRAILSGIPPPADGVLPSKKKTAAGKAKAAVDSAK